MTISIWRYSHLMLAVCSAIFIFTATVTGIVLAFEPISNQLQPYAITKANDLSLAETITTLQNEYDEVVTLSVDVNNFVVASAITKDGKSDTFYVNPFTGERLGDLIKKAPVFEFATNLHRSLFLKSTGRFLVGLFSFFLLLIALTGIKLILKRQGGFKRFFSKVIKENFEQYYHVIIGRWALIPIIIITLTGVYLSLEKFDMLPSGKLVHIENEVEAIQKKVSFKDFEIFKTTTLNDLKNLEFPFSDDEEDYFTLELNDRELYVNQYTGATLSEAKKPLVALASSLSMTLHTGQGNYLWAIILLISCFAILFFMYSGFAMTLNRKKSSAKITNTYSKDEAEYILLVGSETGSTKRFANYFSEALISIGKSVFIEEPNNYSQYKNAKHLVVFTSTYGEGDAPANAKNFSALLHNIDQKRQLKYSVVGFGSLMYPDYCKFALVVDALLQQHKNFIPSLPLFKINNQSLEAFKNWVTQWNGATQHNLKVKLQKPIVNRKKLKDFEVIKNSGLNVDDTYLLQLRPKYIERFQSGDLIAFYPEEDNIERLYSIGRVEDNIVLSIKKHQQGICSTELSTLIPRDMTKAKIKRNLDFHFPDYAKQVVMIANGTGIAPFLGMINENSHAVKTHLFWGGRTQESLQLYSEIIDKAFKTKQLSSFHIAYSQEQEDKIYVQDILKEQEEIICNALKNDGVVMICGSIAMQNRVLEVLDELTQSNLKKPLSHFENNEQLKMDCY